MTGEQGGEFMFRNREDAAHRLARKLKGRIFRNPLVLAIPRGGVVTGAILARDLKADLDVVLSRKLRAPENPEFAMGAISESGDVYLNPDVREMVREIPSYLEEEKKHQLAEIARRKKLFRAVRPLAPVAGRSVLVTDDGIATGSTMIAALQGLKGQGAHEIIVAVPVGSPNRLAEVRRWCNDLVCLISTEDFWAIGQFYEDFEQVEDEQVIELLREFAPVTKEAGPREASGAKQGATPPANSSQTHWEHFAHDADIGVRGIGASREEAFEQTAMALTAVVTDPTRLAPKEAVAISCEAPDDELLLVDWLNALVYQMARKRMLFCRFDVHLADHHLDARAWGEAIDVARHEPAVEIKGATLTSLKVEHKADGPWVAQCVVDV
jgi:putative phosphoribosyl transferase